MYNLQLYQDHHDIDFEHREQRRPLGLSADAVFRHYFMTKLQAAWGLIRFYGTQIL